MSLDLYSLQLNYFGRFLSIFQYKRWQLDPDKFGLVRTLRRLIDLIVCMMTWSWMGQGCCLNAWGDCKILPCILFWLEYSFMCIIYIISIVVHSICNSCLSYKETHNYSPRFLLISRSYYRCTQDNCRVKKRVERLAEDPRMVITTYEGRHIHSPWHDVDDSNASSQLDFIW